MKRPIRKACVIGAGVMGSGIAALLAGCGVECLLLDLPKDGENPNQIAEEAIKKLQKAKPPLLFSEKDIGRIQPGNIRDHLSRIQEVDWVIEAVVEDAKVKQEVFAQVEPHLGEDTIVSSNTSGISLKTLVEGRSEKFRRHFLVTHFFNPVRYMKLLEIVPLEETRKDLLERVVSFAEEHLGKGVVFAKDTPNFIANRIGVYGKVLVIREAFEKGFSIEECDKLFGPFLGRPKSAVFRTADMVGLDTTAKVVQYLYQTLEKDPEREVFQLPSFFHQLVKEGRLGQKTDCGFYKVEKKKGEKQILVLDWKTLEYRPKKEVKIESVERLSSLPLKERLRRFLLEEEDAFAQFARKILFRTMTYALSLIPEVADTILEIDRAMKWGYHWQLGPFETWDALGVEETVAKMKKEGYSLPSQLDKLLKTEEKQFYLEKEGKSYFFDFQKGEYSPIPERRKWISLPHLHRENKIVYHNPSASLLDLGDDVLCVEFHSSGVNAIDEGIMEALERAVEIGEKEFCAIVIANASENFCAGANLLLLLGHIQAKNWDAIASLVDRFQEVNQRLRYASIPVVAAPSGMALGGGCEILLSSHHIHAHMELYTGLVEVGVGLIPAGCGCLNMLKRYLRHIPEGVPYDPSVLIRHIFEIIGKATVSTSARHAQELRFLREQDTITLQRDYLIWEAKQMALARSAHHLPESPWENFHLPGESGFAAIKYGLHLWRETGVITEYDAVVGEKLAKVLCGGLVNFRTPLSEKHILELEKENFLSLVGDPRTVARIEHMLKKKKPLRN